MTPGRSFADELVASVGLGDLAEAADARRPFDRDALARVAAAGNPLVSASLADGGRAASSGVEVTHPWTLRVRAPGLVHGIEDATKVSHDAAALSGIAATEMEMLGEVPAGAPLAHAVELVRSVVAARPDLPLRAFTAAEIDGFADRERRPRRDVVAALRDAGLATLSWRPGCGLTDADLAVHLAAHDAGVRTVAIIGYGHAGADDAFLDRVAAWAGAAAHTRGFLAAMALPDRTDGASPLEGSAGTSDWTACALVRLAFGNRVGRISADWHVVGAKLGATLLSVGADDAIGPQAALRWAPPTDDGPRPLNPDRFRKWALEARRSPVVRDTLYRAAEPTCA